MLFFLICITDHLSSLVTQKSAPQTRSPLFVTHSPSISQYLSLTTSHASKAKHSKTTRVFKSTQSRGLSTVQGKSRSRRQSVSKQRSSRVVGWHRALTKTSSVASQFTSRVGRERTPYRFFEGCSSTRGNRSSRELRGPCMLSLHLLSSLQCCVGGLGGLLDLHSLRSEVRGGLTILLHLVVWETFMW